MAFPCTIDLSSHDYRARATFKLLCQVRHTEVTHDAPSLGLASSSRITDVRDCLRAALNCAVDDELISRNVVRLAKLPAVRKKKGLRWTSEQARRFLTSARDDHDPYYAAYVLILVQGLRKGEVLGLPDDAV